MGGLITSRDSRIEPKVANPRFFSNYNPPVLYVRYSVERQPLRRRDVKGLVLTANMIEYV